MRVAGRGHHRGRDAFIPSTPPHEERPGSEEAGEGPDRGWAWEKTCGGRSFRHQTLLPARSYPVLEFYELPDQDTPLPFLFGFPPLRACTLPTATGECLMPAHSLFPLLVPSLQFIFVR